MQRSITMRIDENLKKQADETLEEIGLNMTAYFTSSLKALVREKKVPFELTTIQQISAAYLAKLDSALEDARKNGAYEYFGAGKFSDTLQKVDI